MHIASAKGVAIAAAVMLVAFAFTPFIRGFAGTKSALL